MDVNKRILLSCAFRYALGRQSYVVGSIVDTLKENWNDLSKEQKKLYHKEINEAIDKGNIGMVMDKNKWEEILELK